MDTEQLMVTEVDHEAGTVTYDRVPETPAPDAPADPTLEAAQRYTQLLPFVKKFCAVMSAKSQARVHHAMAAFPIGESKPRLINNQERQLFHILQELNQQKAIVINGYMKQSYEANKLKEAAMALPQENADDSAGVQEDGRE
jgi:hypothetical protein